MFWSGLKREKKTSLSLYPSFFGTQQFIAIHQALCVLWALVRLNIMYKVTLDVLIHSDYNLTTTDESSQIKFNATRNKAHVCWLLCQTVSPCGFRDESSASLRLLLVSFMFVWQQERWMPAQSNKSPLEMSWMWLAEEGGGGEECGVLWALRPPPCVHTQRSNRQTDETQELKLCFLFVHIWPQESFFLKWTE